MAVSAARPTLSAFAVRQELDQDAATDAAPMAASEPFAHAQAARFQQKHPGLSHGLSTGTRPLARALYIHPLESRTSQPMVAPGSRITQADI